MKISAANRPQYVIVSDCDAPQANMVCQWVTGKGYCYLHRTPSKVRHDGMQGLHATPIEAFGYRWAEDTDGFVRFYLSTIPPSAAYSDLRPRRWQDRVNADFFEYRMLKSKTESRKLP